MRNIFNGTQDYATPSLLDRLNESLNVLTRDNSSLDAYNNKIYTYALLDWRTDIGWQPILAVVNDYQRLQVQQLAPNAVAFLNILETADLPSCDDDADCSGELAGDLFMTNALFSQTYINFITQLATVRARIPENFSDIFLEI